MYKNSFSYKEWNKRNIVTIALVFLLINRAYLKIALVIP